MLASARETSRTLEAALRGADDHVGPCTREIESVSEDVIEVEEESAVAGRGEHEQGGRRDLSRFHGLVVVALVIFLVALAVAIVLLWRPLQIPTIFASLLVHFSLSIAASIVLFEILSSRASLRDSNWTLGGAAAGFFIVFTAFWALTQEELERLDPLNGIENEAFLEGLRGAAESLARVEAANEAPIPGLAERLIERAAQRLDDLADGTYRVPIRDLTAEVIPLIEQTEASYYAIQNQIPDRFWESADAGAFLEKNRQAARRENVEVLRIFVVRGSWDPCVTVRMRRYVQLHEDLGIPVHVVVREEFEAKGGVAADLSDIVVFDERLSGAIEYSQDGEPVMAEFTVRREDVRTRREQFERVRRASRAGGVWRKSVQALSCSLADAAGP
jgi:hypothetical protein